MPCPLSERGLPVTNVTTVTGVDGCPGGWIAVMLPTTAALTSGALPDPGKSTEVHIMVAPALDALPLTGIVGIDIPLGLVAEGWRTADLLARRALGRRGATVFAIPPRPVWQQETYAEANRTCRELTGKGLSAQAWGLRRKLLDADRFRRSRQAAEAGVQLYEVHPELSFAALAGGVPVADSKHSRAGLAARRALLAQAAITLPAKIAGAAENDLLDAAAAAWSARRIAAGTAVALTDPAQRADDGTGIAIRY
jgi:predicted RNase H-like nuclease